MVRRTSLRRIHSKMLLIIMCSDSMYCLTKSELNYVLILCANNETNKKKYDEKKNHNPMKWQ